MGNYKSCAYALSHLPPFYDSGREGKYPALQFCPAACRCVRKKGRIEWAVPESKLSACYSCQKFMREVTIRNDTFRAALYLPRIVELPIGNIRKLFQLIVTAEWDNRETIETLNTFLPEAVEDSKAAWGTASSEYQHGYRLPENVPVAQRRKVNAQNKRLMAEVKSAKTTHEHWKKIATAWNDAKTKYKID